MGASDIRLVVVSSLATAAHRQYDSWPVGRLPNDIIAGEWKVSDRTGKGREIRTRSTVDVRFECGKRQQT